MFSFHDLCGYVMYEDTELVKFKFNAGVLVEAEIITDNKQLLPFDFHSTVNNTIRACEIFLEERVVPPTRIGINEELRAVGLYYDPVILIKLNHGVSVEDHFWIKELDENKKWDDVRVV